MHSLHEATMFGMKQLVPIIVPYKHFLAQWYALD